MSFDHHLKEKISIANKGIGLITRFRKFLPRKTLLSLQTFVRPHLGYGDIIFDNPFDDVFVQYNAALAITGCFRGTSRDKLYQELGLESLSDRRWLRLLFFYKILNGLSARYLHLFLYKHKGYKHIEARMLAEKQ